MGRVKEGKGFARGVSFDRDNISTEEYLQAVLNRMKDQIDLSIGNLATEAENAQLLEDFFNMIGKSQTSSKGEINIPEEFQNYILYNEIKKLGITGNWNFENWFYKKTNSKGITSKQDILGIGFEEYIARLVNKVINTATNKKTSNRRYDFHLGPSQVSLLKNIENDLVEDTMNELVKQVYKEENNRIKEQAKKVNSKINNVNVSVQGKIDVGFDASNINFELIGQDSPELAKILNLLSQATFSAKSYETLGEVSLGQTNSFRVFLATTEGSTTNKIYHWYRMLSCLDNHLDHDSAFYFYQIRYIYELTGYGQIYIKDEINKILGNNIGAKYLIYYHPGTGVKVLSTAVIINNFLQEIKQQNFEEYAKKYENTYEGNSLKNYALGAKLKLRMHKGLFDLY